MGGKALKNTYTERKSTEDFNRIFSEVSSVVTKNLGIECHQVRSYHLKETHGDLDILLNIDRPLNINLKDWVKMNFNPNGVHNNSVISFDYESFQVDLIPINQSIWETAKTFFDYDPTGNLMGKVAHSLGFKYGFQGLVYPLRNFNGRLTEDIVCSRDNKKIFSFLGLDYNRYEEGFDTVQEIFDYIINGTYFSNERFLMENLNSVDRKRNKKRKTYQEFLEYVNTNNISRTYNFKSKEEYIKLADQYFPESKLIEKIKRFKKIDEENQEMSRRFNGHLVMEIYPELKGKKLGSVMQLFKSEFKDFRTYCLETESSMILAHFKEWYENR